MIGGQLGRRVPTDWRHVETHPLTALPARERPARVPVAIGVNWYTAFDTPRRDSTGAYWIARDGRLGTLRGGHCVCLVPAAISEPIGWWDYYDQGAEGACVGFGCSRMMSLLNRRRYDARWLWNQAKAIDEWSDTNPGDDNGTSVRAALDVLRATGHVPVHNHHAEPVSPQDGIAANRWATSIDDVLQALATPSRDYVTLANSWGRSYPRRVRMPASVLERLRQEDGELAIITDR